MHRSQVRDQALSFIFPHVSCHVRGSVFEHSGGIASPDFDLEAFQNANDMNLCSSDVNAKV